MSKYHIVLFSLLTFCLALSGCARSVAPVRFESVDETPQIYPDYTGITIPPNIAPMNFTIETDGDEYYTEISAPNTPAIAVHGKNVLVPEKKWKTLLDGNKELDIQTVVYVHKNGNWKKYAPIVNRIAAEQIDGWIAYRLIEPGYERYVDITLMQRDLASFDEKPFYRNDWTNKEQCANCHSFQNNHTNRMLFHVRKHKGGTLLIQNGKAEKLDLKVDETISSGVYPSWHPDLNLVAMSLNVTSQIFHTVSKAKVEVFDGASDLMLYDVDTNEISHIIQSEDTLETFPYWSPDGNWLYYCSAEFVFSDEVTIEQKAAAATLLDIRKLHAVKSYDKLRYNLMRMSFDRQTKKFGDPELLVDAAAQGKSVSFPRLSPDGIHLMYTLSDFGNFSIWHKESDLRLLNLETGVDRPIDEVNSSEADSFHNWSSNGRWFVFSSRRDDGSYTRLYISYFDKNGEATKPFLLPQRIPQQNFERLKSYNVPEFTTEQIKAGSHVITEALESKPKKATYRR